MTTNRTNVSRIIRAVALIACVPAFGGCGNKQPEDTKESLARDPERLKDVMATCRSSGKDRDDKLCSQAAAAYNQRFFERKSVKQAPAAKTLDTK